MHPKNRNEPEADSSSSRYKITLPPDVLASTLNRGKPAAWVAFINLKIIRTKGHQEELIYPVCMGHPTIVGALEIRMNNESTVCIKNVTSPESVPLFLELKDPYNRIRTGKYLVGVFDGKIQAKVWHQETLHNSRPKPKSRTMPKRRTKKR